jgi:methyl-accepting chemotaxis protein
MQKTIDTIRDVAKNIREASARIRDVVQAIHQSGAIDELVTAVHEAVIAARDTTKEINETAKELKERGVIKETATNVEETVVLAREIGESVKHTVQQIGESAPLTSETLREATTKVKYRDIMFLHFGKDCNGVYRSSEETSTTIVILRIKLISSIYCRS